MSATITRRPTERTSSAPRVRPGQTVENPVTGERFTFTHTAASTDGELLAFDFALKPGGAVPMPHVHATQSERFEVVSGQMRFRVGLRTVIAGPGEVVFVEPGVAHSFANAGDDEAELRVEVRPALAMEEMFADVITLARAGRMNSRGMPRNLLDLALLARTYDEEAHAPLLGLRLQRILLAPPVALARRRGGSFRPSAVGVARSRFRLSRTTRHHHVPKRRSRRGTEPWPPTPRAASRSCRTRVTSAGRRSSTASSSMRRRARRSGA